LLKIKNIFFFLIFAKEDKIGENLKILIKWIILGL